MGDAVLVDVCKDRLKTLDDLARGLRTAHALLPPDGEAVLTLDGISALDIARAIEGRDRIRVVTVQREAVPSGWWVLLFGMAFYVACDDAAAYVAALARGWFGW